MKLAKLSLAAIAAVSLSTGVFAADSLSSALTSGKVSGHLKALYFSRNTTVTGRTSNITDLGIDMTYVTGKFYGLNAGFTFQGVASPWISDNAKVDFNGDMYGTGSVLSEAYLGYANSGFFAKVGRQYISTPLVAGSGSRAIKESFEGYVAGYTGLPDTVVAAGYVTKYQHRTDGFGHPGAFKDVRGLNGEKGAWTIFAVNKSVTGLKLTAAYAKVRGLVGVSYFDVNYNTAVSNGVNVTLGANYYNNSQINNSNINLNAYSAMIGASASGLSGKLAYGKTSSSSTGETFTAGLGNGTGNLYNNTTDGMYFNDNTAGVKNWLVSAAYDLSKVGVSGAKVGLGYNRFSGDTGYKSNHVVGGYVKYAFAGSLKNLSTTFKYATRSAMTAGGNSTHRLRLYLSYKF